MTERRKYSAEFKREAVALTYQPGVSCRQIALEIGVNPNLLSRWKRESGSTINPLTPVTIHSGRLEHDPRLIDVARHARTGTFLRVFYPAATARN